MCFGKFKNKEDLIFNVNKLLFDYNYSFWVNILFVLYTSFKFKYYPIVIIGMFILYTQSLTVTTMCHPSTKYDDAL